MTVDTTEIVGQIRAGNAIGVSLYLRKGGDPDARNHHGWTLLQLAAAEGQGEVVKVLLEANAKVNCCTTDMCTPLHRCATHGYKQVAQYLLEKGAYINAQDKAGNTPLHEAAKGLHTSIIKLLIDHKADVTRVNKKNQTFTDMVGQQIMSTVESGDTEILAQWLDWNLNPNTVGTLHWSLLHHACARGQFEVANLLLERGANVNCVDSNRNTPLHITSQHGHVQIAKLLIDKGANLNAQEQMGNTPLYSAVLGGHPDMICLLLERGIDHTIINKEGVLFTHLVNEFLVNAVMAGDAKTVQGLLKGMADPNSRDPYGMPVLCYAAFKGYLEVTEALLDYGADPNVSDTYLEKTPLHQAASGGHLFVAKALLDKKAHTNAKDKSGAMPLHDAAREGMEDTMSILMGRGAPLNATDADGNTPLHMAAKWGHTEAVEKLVDSGADETIKNKSGNVYSDLALFRAVRTGEQSEVTSGLAWGGDPNCRDSRGWTLLHHAVYKDSLSITQVLLECGAYVDAGDDHGRTPLLLAAYRGSTDIVEVLLDAGANVDARDWHGNTPLHWAAREGSIDTVQLLLKENPDTSIRNKEGFVYTNLLLKHLYFAVRHNDAEKVAKLLAAGADQFARVDGTEVNPREEAKRRGFYEILRQMASLAKKKPRPEEDKIIAIEDVFRLFEEDASQPHQREQEAERCPKDDDSGVKDLDITNKDEEHVANNSEAVYDATIEGKAQDTGTLAESNSHPVKSEVVTNKMVERMEKLNAALDRISMGKQGNGSPAAPTPKVTQSNEKTEMFSSLKSNSEPNLAVSDDNRKNAMDDCLAKVDASLAWLDKRLSRDAAYPPSPIDTSKTSSPAPSPATSEETLVPPSSHVVKGSVTLENSRGVAGSNALKTEGEPGKSSLRLIKVHVNIQERPLAQDTNTTESETDVEKKTSSVENTDDIRVAEEKDSPEILQKHSTMISEDNSSLQERPSSASGSQKAENSQLPSENNTLDEGVKRRYVSQVPHCPELETTEKSEQEEVNDLKTLSANPMTCKPESTGGKEALNQSSRTGGERKTESDQPATHIGETSQGSTKPEGESVHETVEIIQDSDGNQNKESLSAPGENDTASAEVRSKETTGTGTSSLEDENVTAKPEIKETGVQEAKKPSCEYEMALSRSPSPVRRIKKHDSMSPLNLSRENSIEKLFPLPRVAPQRTLWRCSTYDAMSLNDYDNIAAIINKSASFPANWKSVEDWKENFGSIESLNERGKSSSRPKKQENLVELEGNQSSEESDHSTEEESHASQKVGEEKHEERKNEKDGKIREKGDVEEKREVRVKIEEVQKHDKEGEERKVAVATEKTKEAETRDYKTKGEEIEIEVERKIREEIKPNEKSEEEEGEEEKVKTEEKCLNDKQNENIEKRETEDERIPEKEKETKLNKKVNAKKFEEEERKTREKTDGSKRETTDNVEDKRDPQDEEEKTDRNENNEIKKTGDRKETGETRTREFADNSKSENSPPVDAAECKETVNDSTQNLAPKMNITESQESKIAKTETQELSEEPKNIEEKVQEFKQKTLEVQSKIPVTEAVITQDTNEKPETTDRRIEEPECKIPEIKTEAIITENEAQVVEEKASILKNEVSVAEGQVLVSERESQLVEEKTQFVKNENEVVNNENRVTKNEIQAVKDNTMTTKDEVPLVECEVKHEIPLPKNDTPKVTTNTQIEENQAQEIYNENSDNRNLKAKNEAKQDVLTVDKDSQIIVNETTGGEYAKSVKDISIAEGEKQASSKESEINLEATAIPVKPPRGQKSEKSMNSNQTKKAESQTNPTTDPKHTGDTTQRRQDQTILKQIQENKPHGSQEEMQALGNSLQPQNQTQMLEKRSPKPQKHELSQTSKLSEPPELTQTIEKNQATPHESLSPQLQEQTQPQKQAQVPTTKILEPQKQTQAPSTKSAESQKQTQASTTKTPEHQKQTPTPTKKTLEPQKQSQAPARKSPEPQRQTQAPTVKTLEPQRQAQELTRKSPEPQKQSLIPKRKSPDPHSETTVRRSPDPRTETTVRKSPEPQNQTQKSTPPKKTPRTSKKKPSESKKQTQATASKSPDPESKPQTATKRSHDQISSSKSPSDPQNQPQTSTTKPPDPQNQTQPSTTKSHEPHKQTQKQSKTSTEPPKQSETQKRTQTRTSPEPQNQKQRRTSPESQNQAQTPTKKPTQQQKQAKSPVRKSTQQQKQVQGASKKPPQSPKQTQKQVKKGSQSQKQSQMSDKKPPNPASQVQVHEDKTNMSHTQAPVSELLGIQSHEKSSSHNLGEAQVQTQEKKLKSQIPRVQTQTSKSESLGTPVRTETPDNKKVEHSPKTPQPQPLNRAEMKRIPQQPDKTESHDHPGERRENEREQTSHTHHLESPQDQNKLQEEGEHSETPNKGQDFLSNTQVSDETKRQGDVNITHKATGTREQCTATTNTKVQITYDETGLARDKGFPSTDPQLSKTSDRSLENALNRKLTDPPAKPFKKGCPGGEEVTMVATKFCDDIGGILDSSSLSPTHEPVTTLAPPLVPQGTGDEKVMAAAEYKAELTTTTAPEVLVQSSNNDLLCNADRPEAAKVEGNTLSGLASPSRTPAESVKRSESQSENTGEVRQHWTQMFSLATAILVLQNIAFIYFLLIPLMKLVASVILE
ncbi:uncharacterized protein LOC143027732 isoform X6 [Oratosquilla oratoria]|uniref:uncharacterized protein LOC143027732 isoform X6 n=1 Tax=Oratosquilla oratoria TaxID=337810 RepID=UPI003F75CE78